METGGIRSIDSLRNYCVAYKEIRSSQRWDRPPLVACRPS